MRLADRPLRASRPAAATGRCRSCTASTAAPTCPRRTLDHFEGYRGSRPVRIGNGAADQLQLDIYGELIDSVYLYNKYGAPISYDALDGPRAACVDWLCENWDQPDEGIWETRGGRQHFTYSRLMCWVAIERAIRLARAARPARPTSSRWLAARDQIYDQIMTRGWNDEAPGVRPALRHRRARRLACC